MIEYIEEEHLYLYEGVIIPSVTQILQYKFPNKYSNVPKYILENKAQYGTMVHQIIQDLEEKNLDYINTNNVYMEMAQEEYKKIKKCHNLEVLNQEQMVHYKDQYAGRLDMIALVENKLSLIDIKTTAKLDEEYLSWQLSLYELAFGKRFSHLYCLWLPKGKEGQLVLIKRKKKQEILDLIKEYNNEHNSSSR